MFLLVDVPLTITIASYPGDSRIPFFGAASAFFKPILLLATLSVSKALYLQSAQILMLSAHV